MMMMPFFSIVTVNYNDAEGLERTIKSVLEQKFTNYEHIIIDGASTDGSIEIIKKYESLYPSGLLTWLSEADGGIYHAMNKGIKLAKGIWLNMMNAGDWFDAHALQVVSGYVDEQPDVEAFISPIRWCSHSKEHYLQPFAQALVYPIDLPTCPMRHQGIFYLKALHLQYGLYHENLKFAADYAFELELFYKNKTSFYPISSCFVNFVDGGVGSTHESWLESQQLRIEYGIVNPIQSPFFSIVTVNYNDAEGLERTIKSVLEQKFTNYEHIIIDGASTDGSIEIIKKYESLYPSGLLTWLSEADGGIYHAMNKGIKLAKGIWLNMMNAGDWFDAHALQVVSGYVDEQPDVEAFISPTRWCSHSKEHYLQPFQEELIYPSHLWFRPLAHQALFYKKELHANHGLYHENLKFAADYAFELELFYKNKTSFYPISSCFVNFVDGGVGSTHESWLESQQLRIEYGIIAAPTTKIQIKKIIKWLLPYGVWAIKQRLKNK